VRALLYQRFGATPELVTVPDPAPPTHGAVIEVQASGVCRSDWHGWLGHDPSITLPHVPGHEFAGVVRAVGADVGRFRGGERVTAPFVNGCGACPECAAGHQQVCRQQTQPGFTHWGSFAEYVVVDHADVNLVGLPDDVDMTAAASLGCRLATSFGALVDQAGVRADEWVAVHGCGGVGLSAVMIAAAVGARVIAVDVVGERLALARTLGADVTVDAGRVADVGEAVRELSGGGAHVSLDAIGSIAACVSSVSSLRRRGRHVQVGLLLGEEARPPLPMDQVIAHELRVIGSHGLPAHRYAEMLAMMETGRLDPARLVARRVGLEEAGEVLVAMDRSRIPGLAVITSFGA
jgi:alcohol dehydrogenase